MTTQFYINPGASKFRSTKAGDSAISPSNSADVIFDAFGPRYGGVILNGNVPWSSFAGPVGFTLPANAKSANYYYWQLNYASAFSYIPLIYVSYQNSSGAWGSTYNSGTISYYTSGGIQYPQGTSAQAGFFSTTTYLFLYIQVVAFVNSTSWTPPTHYSYRVYGL